MAFPHIGFVGKPNPTFIHWLKEHGYYVVGFVDQNTFSDYSDRYPTQDVSKIYKLDFSNKSRFLDQLTQVTEPIQALVGTYENAVVPRAWLSEHFSVPSYSEEAALASTDKLLMRMKFQQLCPQFSPRFASVESWHDIEQFLAQTEIRFPLILKPANLFKSLLVTKNDTLDELQTNFQESLLQITDIYAKEGVMREPSFVIEEYLVGRAYSVDVLADKQGHLLPLPPVDLVMGRDLGGNDNYNYSRKLPSALSQQDQALLQSAACAGVQALNLVSTTAHVELVYTEQGPKLIEIGARAGGYRPRMYGMAYGVDLYQAQLDVALGQLPQHEFNVQEYTAVYELFPENEGQLQEITALHELHERTSLQYLSLKRQVGEFVGFAKNGHRAVAIIILSSTDKQQFEQDALFVESQVRVITTNH